MVIVLHKEIQRLNNGQHFLNPLCKIPLPQFTTQEFMNQIAIWVTKANYFYWDFSANAW